MYLNSRKILSFLFIMQCALVSALANAEVAVIVNPANDATFTHDDIASLFLAKTKKFPNKETAVVVDRPEGSSIRVSFTDTILKRNEQQLKSYWSRLIFTGKGVPPQQLESDDEVKGLVSRNPDTMGYIDAASVDDSVKVIATF